MTDSHLKLPVRKKSVRAAEQDRGDGVAAREALRKAQPTLDPKRLTFIDETAAATKMTRLCGKARGGWLMRSIIAYTSSHEAGAIPRSANLSPISVSHRRGAVHWSVSN
jgi:hypothetical protein